MADLIKGEEGGKICPRFDYRCEAYDGKFCCLVAAGPSGEEPCHYLFNLRWEKMKTETALKCYFPKNIENIKKSLEERLEKIKQALEELPLEV